MTGALLKDIFRSVRGSMSRFISMIVIVALGAGFFVGVKSTGPSMSQTAADYFEANNLLDLRVFSPLGLTDSDVEQIRGVEGVDGVMAQKFVDALVLVNGEPEIDIDGSQISTRAYGLSLAQFQEFCYGGDDESFINRPTLLEGTYPTQANQCLVDASALSTPQSFQIGSVITLEADANADLSSLTTKQFQIVGIIRSPYYVSFERGNSLVGSGKIGTYIYIPDSAINSDYYSEIYVSVGGADELDPYSSEYESRVSVVSERIEAIAGECVEVRANELRDTLPTAISDAQKKYDENKETAESALSQALEQVELYQKYVDDPTGSYNEAVSEAAQALGIAQSQFEGGSQEYLTAVETYNSYLAAYKTAVEEQEERYSQWSQASSEVTSAQSAVNTASNAVSTASTLVSSTNNVITTANSILTSLEEYQQGNMTDSQLAQILATLQSINPDLYASISSLSAVSMATQAIALINPYLEAQKQQLAVYESELASANEQLSEYQQQLQTAQQALTVAKAAYYAADAQLDSAEEQLNEMYKKISGSQTDLTLAQIELMMNESSVGSDLKLLKATIANASSYLETAQQEYTKLKASVQTQLAEAEKSIESAKKMISRLDTASWSVYTRSATPGYSSYESAVGNVEVLSNIFPLIFFIVAALVCFTTMSRMVEEELTRMGTLKALGYSNSAIASKFVLYALFASIIGSLIGIVIGIFVLPYAISKAYSIMFTLPQLEYVFPVKYIILGVLISVITTVSAAVLASARELRVHSATLMRPKAPAPGKRILLEKIPFLWKHISFTGKVTARNIFRKKGRLIMTVFGIGGCTALILASIGLFGSVNNIMKKQFGDDAIAKYDVQIVFGENQPDDSALMTMLESDNRIESVMLSSLMSVTGGSDNSDKTQDVYLFVPKNTEKLSEYVNLRNRKSGETLALNDTGAIVTEKFASDMSVTIGDSVWVEDADGTVTKIPIAGIAENYAFSYIYLTENLYQYLFQTSVSYNHAVGILSASVLDNSAVSGVTDASQKKSQLAVELMAYDGINAVSFVSDTMDTLNEVIGVLSIIIAIFIGAAALLAVTVLYNLSNINISERQRELATIKVLGFHAKEMTSYIYRESAFMTVFGIAFGLLMGVGVHKLLLIYCSVDAVMFVQSLSWYSFAAAVLATALFSIIVNSMVKKKIIGVDMVESLKAIE